MSEISRTQFIEWKNSPVTRKLVEGLETRCKAQMNSWMSRQFISPDNQDLTLQATLIANGELTGMSTAIKLILTGEFTTLIEE